MKFVHLSDLHIGKMVKDFSMIEDQRFIFNQIIDIVVKEKVDAVLISGDVKSEEEYRNIRGSSETEAGMDWAADVQIICQTLWKSRELISEAVGSDVGAILARFHEDAQRTGNFFIMLREKYEPKPEQNKGHEPWSDGIITSNDDYYSSYSRSYDNKSALLLRLAVRRFILLLFFRCCIRYRHADIGFFSRGEVFFPISRKSHCAYVYI